MLEGLKKLFNTVKDMVELPRFEEMFFTSYGDVDHNVGGIHMIILFLFVQKKRGSSLKSEKYSELFKHVLE